MLIRISRSLHGVTGYGSQNRASSARFCKRFNLTRFIRDPMNKILQFPLVRMLIAVLCIGIAIAVGQAVLSIVRSLFSITNTGLANLLFKSVYSVIAL